MKFGAKNFTRGGTFFIAILVVLLTSHCGEFDFATNTALLKGKKPVPTPTPDVGTALAVSGPSSFILNGQCNPSPIVITAVDGSNREVAPAKAITISLAGFVPGQISFYKASGCSQSDLISNPGSMPLSAGSSHLQLYAKVFTKRPSTTINLMASAIGLTTSPAARFTVVPIPISLSFNNNIGPLSLTLNQCGSPYIVSLLDYEGDLVQANGTVNVLIDGLDPIWLFQNTPSNPCSQQLPVVSDGSGSSYGMVSITNASSGSFSIYAGANGSYPFMARVSDGSLSQTNQLTLTIAQQPYFNALALSVKNGSNFYTDFCSYAAAVTLTALDQNQNPINVNNDVYADLSFFDGTGTFYSDSSCSTPITRVKISASSSNVKFFIVPTSANSMGKVRLKAFAQNTGTSATYLDLPVQTGALALSFQGIHPSSVSSGGTANYTVLVKDPYGNNYNSDSPLYLELDVTPSNYNGSLCFPTNSCQQTNSIQLQVPANSSTAMFSIQPQTAQNITLSISNPNPNPLTNTLNQNVTVN